MAYDWEHFLKYEVQKQRNYLKHILTLNYIIEMNNLCPVTLIVERCGHCCQSSEYQVSPRSVVATVVHCAGVRIIEMVTM